MSPSQPQPERHQHQQQQHTKKPSPSQPPALPKFEPLPPTNILNRLINALLAPLFYLVFTLITSIVVVPVYVIIDNFKHGRGKRGGQRVAKDESERHPEGRNKASSFLREYGRSHSAAASKDE
ncbi:hypothetical protein A1O7_06365 [Cladophialophora yegresii CBS 114405]|uniref:Uncharacterized protein n=1 Tax=Cladophialophora yegresii CBS 114405 TaxID=1182544 RepID=W9WKF0_9EURO|nr:uncharacterized protein A1O7_06365 [Cladophialophora yegresii CBS 114405]EXJ58934.1 hypothetical protein A1O7_06365 [Cladophialophora yegresii CBS 114405]